MEEGKTITPYRATIGGARVGQFSVAQQPKCETYAPPAYDSHAAPGRYRATRFFRNVITPNPYEEHPDFDTVKSVGLRSTVGPMYRSIPREGGKIRPYLVPSPYMNTVTIGQTSYTAPSNTNYGNVTVPVNQSGGVDRRR